MTQAMTTRPSQDVASAIETVLMTGDLRALSPEQRVIYHNRVCESLGLNPLTRPFDYLTLNGKTILYARKDATDQLRGLKGISITGIDREQVGDLYVVTAHASTRDGRTDESLGAVNVKGLQGENLANALMKAETKAKRRVTLSIAGLGLLDESEVDSASEWTEPVPAREPIQQPRRRSERDLAAEADQLQGVNEETGEAWSSKELSALMKGSGLIIDDIAQLVGYPIAKDPAEVRDAVNDWLARNEGKPLSGLIEAAKPFKERREARVMATEPVGTLAFE